MPSPGRQRFRPGQGCQIDSRSRRTAAHNDPDSCSYSSAAGLCCPRGSARRVHDERGFHGPLFGRGRNGRVLIAAPDLQPPRRGPHGRGRDRVRRRLPAGRGRGRPGRLRWGVAPGPRTPVHRDRPARGVRGHLRLDPVERQEVRATSTASACRSGTESRGPSRGRCDASARRSCRSRWSPRRPGDATRRADQTRTGSSRPARGGDEGRAPVRLRPASEPGGG